jgi:pimeloyl-ACP methyl ester carboxylesterase
VASYIFIHGGFHGAWCWDRVMEPLEAAGHVPAAIDLPGRGADAAHVATVTLEDYVECVAGAVARFTEPVILVAHSQGGVSASQFAERHPTSVKRLVYISAIVPASGENGLMVLSWGGPESVLLTEGAMVPAADGRSATVAAEWAVPAFYEQCSPQDAAWASAQLCVEPVAPLATPVDLSETGFGSVPSTYIGASGDRAVPIVLQHQLAERCGADFQAIDSDHSPFLSATDELVGRLVALA